MESQLKRQAGELAATLLCVLFVGAVLFWWNDAYNNTHHRDFKQYRVVSFSIGEWGYECQLVGDGRTLKIPVTISQHDTMKPGDMVDITMEYYNIGSFKQVKEIRKHGPERR